VPGAQCTQHPPLAVLNERTMETDVAKLYVAPGAIPARLLVRARRCRCVREICSISQQYGKLLFGKGKSERVDPLSARVAVFLFPLSGGILSGDTRGEREREMMMTWCRRGEKTVETFPKRRRRDKQRQQLCVLLFGMQETSPLPASERTHRPRIIASSLRFSSVSNQSINLFFCVSVPIS
jgi:hypothetical protein